MHEYRLNSTDVYDRNVSGNNTVEISEVPAKVDDLHVTFYLTIGKWIYSIKEMTIQKSQSGGGWWGRSSSEQVPSDDHQMSVAGR